MKHRVVLVDDVPELRQVLRLILEHAGPFEVVGEGSNGHDALRLAGELQPDLIVMDVEMRGGPTGWQVLPDLRQTAPGAAVVILSGSAADPMRTEREAMADGVLEKGLAPQELNDALLAILGEAGAPATVPAASPSEPRGRGGGPSDPAAVLAAVLQVTSDAVVRLAPDGRVVSWNPAAERTFGAPDSLAGGEPFAGLVDEQVRGPVREATAGGRVEHSTVEVTRADGSPRPVHVSVTAMPGGEIVIVARDTQAARSDEAVASALAELDRARRELDGFASVASHDLAQPLQVAYAYLEMVRAEFNDGMDETAAAWIDAAVASLERMRVLVQDILAYARGGNRDVQPRPASVEEAARSALSALRGLAQERNADVRLRPPLPTVSGHDGHLATVLERLLDNAVRFVPEHRVPVVEVFADEGDDEWVITVADNGPGIPEELAERVFDVFYRDARTTIRGTGLGLSLARKLVHRMGGRIWVEPRPGDAEGTWMRFALPKSVT